MSTFSIGQMNQVGDAFESVGFTADEMRQLGQTKKLLVDIRGTLNGTHEIRPIDYLIDLSVPCKLPFSGAERVSPTSSGVVKLERRGDDLYLDGKKIELFLSLDQKGDLYIVGHDLRKELEARGGNISAKVLDYLEEHPELWPESWKRDKDGNTVYVYFWGDVFRNSGGRLCVRCGCWRDGRVVSDYLWLDNRWGRHGPAASVAS